MADEPNIAMSAALIGDPTRAAILLALFDGRAQPAGALAYAANVTAQVASNHLARLVAGDLLAVEKQGRHRYYRLANARVAGALEALSALAAPVRSIERPRSPKARELRFARCCYDHLAGRVGVAIAETLERRGVLTDASGADPDSKLYDVSEDGRRWLRDLGVETDLIKRARRGLARRCLDWTERRHHIAGPLARMLFTHFCAQGWLAREGGTRAVRVRPKGEKAFRERFGIDIAAMRAAAAEASG
jgi:DNA-binding transcriptional ArsR family regulator